MSFRSWGALLLVLVLGVVVSCEPTLRRGGGDDDDSAADDDGTGGGSLSGPLDLLFVIDNSNSMARIQEEVQLQFGQMVVDLANSEVDFRLAVTTTDLDSSGNGNQGNLRSVGSLGGAECQEPEVLSPTSGDLQGAFASLVNVGVAGSGDERGLYAAALAMCKGKDETWWASLDSLPDGDPHKEVCGLVPAAERGCNTSFFRDEATTVVIVISDEGDDTERLEWLPPPTVLADCVKKHTNDPLFGECDCRLSWWVDFFEGIGQPVTFVTVGPTWQDATMDAVQCDGSVVNYPGPCNPFGNTVCSIDFYQQIACETGGLFRPVEETTVDDDPSTCELADFGSIASDLLSLAGAR